MGKNVADQLVDLLVENNIKRIYAVTGDSLNQLNDAVRRNGKIKWIHVRHEEAGAFAAAAEAELNGFACCAGSSGPGHVHLINGLYDAHRSRLPLLAIAATIPSSEFGTEYFQETNTIRLFEDCSWYNQVIQTAAQAPRMIQAAIQQARHRKGVAVIGLPGDIAALPAETTHTSTHHYTSESLLRPTDPELEKLAAILNKPAKVAIFCGIGASDAHDLVVALAKRLQAPVGYTFRGKMGIQFDNPYEVGMTGLLGLPAAYHSMHEADIVLLLGTDFPYTQFMPVKNRIIQIDDSPEKLGRRARLELGLCGNIKDTLTALLPRLTAQTDDAFLQGQLQLYAQVKKHLQIYVDEKGKTDLIHPEFVAATIDRLADADAIFTMDTGMSCVWAARYIQATGRRQFLGSFNHGSMANAMPMAIGAGLSQPGRQVVAFCGDGGLSMLLGDLATLRQYQIPAKLVVFNNRTLGMVKLEMEVAGLLDNETDMVNPDFAAVAKAMGFRGIAVHEPEELEGALHSAFSDEGPVLVEVFTDPSALAMPPKIEWEQVKGYAVSMTKMMLGGRFDEMMDTIRSNYRHAKEILGG